MTPNQIYRAALKAGTQAWKAAKPVPMIVEQRASVSNDKSPVVKTWTVSGGPCGYASVNIRPATSRFVRFLKEKNIGHKAYQGGWSVGVPMLSRGPEVQSLARNEAFASAFAAVLNENGIVALVESRMD